MRYSSLLRFEKMSFQSRSEAVGTPNRVLEWVWKRVPFRRTGDGESPTTKRANEPRKCMLHWLHHRPDPLLSVSQCSHSCNPAHHVVKLRDFSGSHSLTTDFSYTCILWCFIFETFDMHLSLVW